MKKKWINLLLFSLITVCCNAQTAGYTFYCKLDTVKASGFYNIEFTPKINAHLKTDYSDLRIVNEAAKWIPHILHAPAYERTTHDIARDLKFSITENSKANTGILIESSQKISSSIGLIITNTAAERFCTLSGSDDKKNWFAINDSILLNPAAAENKAENMFSINFPQTNYRFYKIVIHNVGKDPFNIKAVVEYSGTQITNPLYKLKENPAAAIQQKDSGKISYIKITRQQPFQFNNISLQLSGVKYYTRNVDLYLPYAANSSFSNPGQLLTSFTLSNNSTLRYNVPLTKASVFYLLISNEDNLPLAVSEVKTAVSSHYITAYLEKDSNYRLIMDNADAVIPDYDLSKLNSKIPDSNAVLGFGKITALAENNPVETPVKNNTWIIWSAIAAALLILLFFTYRMFKEVDKRGTK
jgi:hypothetical protein